MALGRWLYSGPASVTDQKPDSYFRLEVLGVDGANSAFRVKGARISSILGTKGCGLGIIDRCLVDTSA